MARECMIKKVQKTYCTLWRDLKSNVTDVSEEKKMQWYLKETSQYFCKMMKCVKHRFKKF